MITENLFDSILIQPAQQNANKLYIVSGYATAAMAFRHLKLLRDHNQAIQIRLIVGMCSLDGLSQSNHRAFQELMQTDYPGFFMCSYLTEAPPVHSKVYTWYKDDTPFCGFSGSANYTQTAFGSAQREAMTASDPLSGYEYYKQLNEQTIYCNHPEAEDFVRIYNDNYYTRLRREREAAQQLSERKATPDLAVWAGLPSVRVSLLARNGSLPQRSGLNWGQRPEVHREPNQAYIRLPSVVSNTDFFPERTVEFTVLTDDGRVLNCSRAQDNGKAIHTPHNNSLIGEYFRNRLGVPNGAPVATNDLLHYGRADVVFYKIDDETYYMDFSASPNG